MQSLSERFSLGDIVDGLAADLIARREGIISIEDARVRAELAKQIIAGVRIYLQAQKFLEQSLNPKTARAAIAAVEVSL